MELTICLFREFQVKLDDTPLSGFESHKVQELLAYLCLYRDRPHPREAIADLLWPESTTAQALKSLRHVLWQAQGALNSALPDGGLGVLEADSERIWIHPRAADAVDVARFEHACVSLQGKSGHDLDEPWGALLQDALALYRGDLLEGWYQDWCLYERERLQRLYLVLLEKQMLCCEARGEYEAGLESGFRALRYDMAVEKIHRHIMRLYYLGGDRTAALRQYERCVTFLRQELDVSPSRRTTALYERIRSDRPQGARDGLSGSAAPGPWDMPLTLSQALGQLRQAQAMFQQIGQQIQEAIRALETVSLDKQ